MYACTMRAYGLVDVIFHKSLYNDIGILVDNCKIVAIILYQLFDCLLCTVYTYCFSSERGGGGRGAVIVDSLNVSVCCAASNKLHFIFRSIRTNE